MHDFAVVAYQDGMNYIILAEGSGNEITEIYEVVKDLNSDKDIRLIDLDRDQYNSSKKVLMLLNQYITSCDKEDMA